MDTIHNEIDNWLAADLHDELSDSERSEFHTHLVECPDCRHLHQKNKIMDKLLNETLSDAKPDPRFEQRMLAGFRNRIPLRRGGIGNFIADLVRLRAARIAAVAVALLTLVQLGQMITRRAPSVQRTAGLATFAESKDERQQAIARAFDQRRRDPNVTPAGTPNRFFDQIAKSKESQAALSNDLAQSIASAPPPSPETGDKNSNKAGRIAGGGAAIVTGSNIPIAEEAAPTTSVAGTEPGNTDAAPPPALANRKLIRNATVELEIGSFDESLQKITALANQGRGYVATTSSEKQANGKLKGEIVVKVLPENLDRFLQGVRGLGELKNQTLGTEDITKQYFDTDARLKNSRVMEQRLIDMLKKKSDDINDLLQVEKELGRVREDIEKMQGELKFWDSQIQFATVTITLAEKDLEEPAAFLLKERARLALYSPEVEKVYNDIKALASPKIQITNAQLDRDNVGRVSGRVSLLISPEESESVIGKVKGMGRVENFQVQTERIAQDGTGMSENAKTKRDKVELNITISRDEQEQALQQTSLRIRSSAVDAKTRELRTLATKQGGRVRSSSFSRDPDGRESSDVSLRVPMENYPALMRSLGSLGKLENVSVLRQDRTDAQIDEANAPADISIQVYSQGNLVSEESSLWSTLRRTIGQSASALMWSLRMVGVAVAFLVPWVIVAVAAVWIVKRIRRARASRKTPNL